MALLCASQHSEMFIDFTHHLFCIEDDSNTTHHWQWLGPFWSQVTIQLDLGLTDDELWAVLYRLQIQTQILAQMVPSNNFFLKRMNVIASDIRDKYNFKFIIIFKPVPHLRLKTFLTFYMMERNCTNQDNRKQKYNLYYKCDLNASSSRLVRSRTKTRTWCSHFQCINFFNVHLSIVDFPSKNSKSNNSFHSQDPPEQ